MNVWKMWEGKCERNVKILNGEAGFGFGIARYRFLRGEER